MLASDRFVYVTTRYYLAWAYAHASGGEGSPIVVLVKPQEPVEPDPEHSDAACAYRCKSARIYAVDAKQPFNAAVASAGWKGSSP